MRDLLVGWFLSPILAEYTQPARMGSAQSYPPTSSALEGLLSVSRRLKLGYSRSFLANELSRERSSDTAFGLVHVAPRLGMRVTAVQTGMEMLEESGQDDSAVLLHFPQAGFGSLEHVGPQGVSVRDEMGSRTLSWEEMEEVWQGTTLVFERSEQPGEREPSRLRNRVRDFFHQQYDARVQLAGPNAQPWLRRGLLLAVAALALWPSVSPLSIWVAAFTMLQIAGLSISFALSRIEAGELSIAEAFCGPQGGGCRSLLSSNTAKSFGISTAGLGFAFYSANLAMFVTRMPGAIFVAGVLCGVGVVAGLWFVSRQVAQRTFCNLCMAVHATSLTAFLLFIGSGVTVPPMEGLLPAVGAWGLLFSFFTVAVVPHLSSADRFVDLQLERRIARRAPPHSLNVLSKAALCDLPNSFGVGVAGQGQKQSIVFAVQADCTHCHRIVSACNLWADRYGDHYQVRFAGVSWYKNDPRGALMNAAVRAVPMESRLDMVWQAFEIARTHRSRLRKDAWHRFADLTKVPVDRLLEHREWAERQEAVAKDLLKDDPRVPLVVVGRRMLRDGYDHVLENLPVLIDTYGEAGILAVSCGQAD